MLSSHMTFLKMVMIAKRNEFHSVVFSYLHTSKICTYYTDITIPSKYHNGGTEISFILNVHIQSWFGESVFSHGECAMFI